MSDFAERVARLSDRQAQCLRLAARPMQTKEIAAELGLAYGTVAGYISESVAILGARNRTHAARLLAAWEEDPNKVRVEFVGGEAEAVSPEARRGTSAIEWRSLLPFRTKGSPHNELPIGFRLLWIPLIAVVLAGGFAFVVGGADVLSNLVARLLHR